jgi:hypothetical protein
MWGHIWWHFFCPDANTRMNIGCSNPWGAAKKPETTSIFLDNALSHLASYCRY